MVLHLCSFVSYVLVGLVAGFAKPASDLFAGSKMLCSWWVLAVLMKIDACINQRHEAKHACMVIIDVALSSNHLGPTTAFWSSRGEVANLWENVGLG